MATRIGKVLEATHLNEYISKEGDKWVVKSKSGKVLGKHDSKEDALKQLAAVEISKAKHKGEAKNVDLTKEAMKLQDQVVDYVQELADYAGAELDFDNSDFDGKTLYLGFKPDDMITMGDYSADDLVDDVKKKLLKGKHHVLIDHEEGEGFQLQVSVNK